MGNNELEGQEVDLLIKRMSTGKEVATAQPEPPPPPPSPKPVVERSTFRAAAPPVGSRGFVSAISVQPAKEDSWIKEHLTESIKERIPVPTGTAVVWMCVGLAVALGLAMPFWPYPKASVWWLLLYLLAVAMVVVAGVWAARLTWATRLGAAHMVAIGVVCWGITLAAEETLPRMGYAQSETSTVCR